MPKKVTQTGDTSSQEHLTYFTKDKLPQLYQEYLNDNTKDDTATFDTWLRGKLQE